MKFLKSYLIDHAEEIGNTVYGYCTKRYNLNCIRLSDNSTACFFPNPNMIYKFTTDNELIIDHPVIDVDKSTIYEEEKIKLTSEDMKKFIIIGDLGKLLEYIEIDWEVI